MDWKPPFLVETKPPRMTANFLQLSLAGVDLGGVHHSESSHRNHVQCSTEFVGYIVLHQKSMSFAVDQISMIMLGQIWKSEKLPTKFENLKIKISYVRSWRAQISKAHYNDEKNTQYYIGCPWCFHGSIISVYYVSSAAERCFPDSSTHITVPTNAHVTHSLWSVQCPNFTSYSLMLLDFYWLLFKKSLNLLTFISLYLLTTAFL